MRVKSPEVDDKVNLVRLLRKCQMQGARKTVERSVVRPT